MSRYFDLFEITGLPGTVEGCAIRAIDAEVREPAFIRHGFDPLGVMADGAWPPSDDSPACFLDGQN
ncbi:MAG: hypothetical protein JO210_15315 [Acidobacteriaceae bacterium]|nr:hypothetical protein [Acidobacteriaceae bacterium]